uniref:DUF3149 domain-containing protein n=1 Tax=Parastrongyloides trichosuri TaxID=131310 RepID=A0A0N4ZTH6_PARTI
MYGSQHVLSVIDYFAPFLSVFAFLLGVAIFTLTVVKYIYSKNDTNKLNAHSLTSFRGKPVSMLATTDTQTQEKSAV